MAGHFTNVAIVDSDDAVRDALKFALELQGFRVFAHSRAADLLADPDMKIADCLVTSDSLAGMDCFQLIDQFGRIGINIPVIVVTGHATARLRHRASASGVRLVLEKPLLENSLAEAILGVRGHAAWAAPTAT